MYQNRNNERIVLALYTSGYKRELYLREIARLAKLPLKTTQLALAKLEQQNILKSAIHGKNKYFSLNRDNVQTKIAVMQAELYKTSRFLEQHSVFALFMKEITSNTPLILFGSVAKGTAQKHSDVDLLIIAESEQQLPLHLLPYKAHVITLSENVFRKSLEQGEALMKEIEKEHILLNNHSMYVDMMWNHYGR